MVVCFVQDWGELQKGQILMRRLLIMAAFGFGFYYLWNNTDTTIDLLAVGCMGVAVLLEFSAPD